MVKENGSRKIRSGCEDGGRTCVAAPTRTLLELVVLGKEAVVYTVIGSDRLTFLRPEQMSRGVAFLLQSLVFCPLCRAAFFLPCRTGTVHTNTIMTLYIEWRLLRLLPHWTKTYSWINSCSRGRLRFKRSILFRCGIPVPYRTVRCVPSS